MAFCPSKFQKNRIQQWMLDVFSLDTRSLSVFRIGLGLVILYDLALLLPDTDAFFGPNSVYPIVIFKQDPQFLFHWTFHALSDTPLFIYSLFALNALLAVLLMAGYCTRPVTFLCWLMAVSLAHRNPSVMYLGRDYALILFLLWGMFLPLGQTFSVDALLKKDASPARRIFSLGSVGLIISLMMIYLLCGWFKTHPSWNQELSALSLVYNNPDFATPLGVWLLRFPLLLKALTWLTVFVERYGILLIFLPFKTNFFRGLLIAFFFLFHLATMSTMIVEWFALVMISAWGALIPYSWWQKKHASPAAVETNTNAWANLLAGLLIIFMLLVHYQNAKEFFFHSPKSALFKAAQIPGLDFPWHLFSPSPPLTYKQIIIVPIFKQAQGLPNNPLDMEIFLKSYQLSEKKSYRWKFLIQNINGTRLPFLKSYLIDYWNQRYPRNPRVKDVMIYILEKKL